MSVAARAARLPSIYEQLLEDDLASASRPCQVRSGADYPVVVQCHPLFASLMRILPTGNLPRASWLWAMLCALEAERERRGTIWQQLEAGWPIAPEHLDAMVRDWDRGA